MTLNRKKRNGRIELYRFIFAIYVLLFHFEKYFMGEPSLKDGFHLALFPHGSIGVEFFFLLSGFFMAKSIKKKRNSMMEENGRIVSKPADWIRFMAGKYSSIFPYHVIAFVFSFATYVMFKGFDWKHAVVCLIDSIPNFLLVQMSGISLTNPNHVEWYISCMLLAMCIIYPFALRYYEAVYTYIAPVFAVFAIGYLMYTTNALTGVSVWMGFCFKATLRAVIEILLGGTAYELSEKLSRLDSRSSIRKWLPAAEAAAFFFTFIFAVITVPSQYEVYALALLFILVTVSGADISHAGSIFNSRICFFLGRLSLPVYLSQISVVWMGQKYGWEGAAYLPLFLIFVLILSVAVMTGGNLLKSIFTDMHMISAKDKRR